MEKRKGKIKNAHAVNRIRKREREGCIESIFSRCNISIFRWKVINHAGRASRGCRPTGGPWRASRASCPRWERKGQPYETPGCPRPSWHVSFLQVQPVQEGAARTVTEAGHREGASTSSSQDREYFFLIYFSFFFLLKFVLACWLLRIRATVKVLNGA